MTLAAILTGIILGGLAVFQLALILGAPMGRFAWGGQHQILPKQLRISSAVAILLYAGFTLIVFNRAELITIFANSPYGNIAIWVLFAYLTLGIGMNALSRSKPERSVMTPITVALAILVLIIAVT